MSSISDFIKKSNKKKALNEERILELKQYYMSMYRHYMLKLYDKGYIGDPTVFDESQVRHNIVDMKIQGMSDTIGKFILTSERVVYAYYKNKDKHQRNFLTLLYYTLKYKEFSQDLDLFYETFGNSIQLKLGLVASKVVSKTGLNLSKGSLSVLVPSGKTLEVLNIKDTLWELAMKILEVPEAEWHLDGLLDADLTHDEEVRCIKSILEEGGNLNGKYAKVLERWLHENKWSDSSMFLNRLSMLEYIYSHNSDEVFNSLLNKLNEVNETDVIAIHKECVYVAKDISKYYVPISSFAIVSGYEDILVGSSNSMYGYSGEAYSLDYLIEEGLSFIGVPIKVVLDDGTEDYFYDREQVVTECSTWFSEEGASFSFDGDEYVNPFSDVNSVEYAMFEIYNNSQSGEIGYIDLEKFNINEIEKSKAVIAKLLMEAE